MGQRAVAQHPVYQYNSSISIGGSAEYQRRTAAILDQFLSTSTGQHWLAVYAMAGRKTILNPVSVWRGGEVRQHALNPEQSRVTNYIPGVGSDTRIDFDPSYAPTYRVADGSLQRLEPFQVMGHELIHSLHIAQGTNQEWNTLPGEWTSLEERRVIGGNPDASPDYITEATLAEELGKLPRQNHQIEGEWMENAKGKLKYKDFTQQPGGFPLWGTLAIVGAAAFLIMWLLLRNRRVDNAPDEIGQAMGEFNDQVRDVYTPTPVIPLGASLGTPHTLGSGSDSASTSGMTLETSGSNPGGSPGDGPFMVVGSAAPDQSYHPFLLPAGNNNFQPNPAAVQAAAYPGRLANTPQPSPSAAFQNFAYGNTLNKDVSVPR